jgi:hypothetical protein
MSDQKFYNPHLGTIFCEIIIGLETWTFNFADSPTLTLLALNGSPDYSFS